MSGPWTDPDQHSVTFNAIFTVTPRFALLLHGFKIYSAYDVYLIGYDVEPDQISKASAQFHVSNLNHSETIKVLKFRWVASQGDDLQLFPVSCVFTSRNSIRTYTIFDIPFNYPNLVRWGSGTFEVAITSVISSFQMVNDWLDNYVVMCVAKWDGSSAYAYTGTAIILPNSALFGTNCPFTTVGGVNVVKMARSGYQGSTVKLYLIFHKVSTTGAVKTGFAVVRN